MSYFANLVEHMSATICWLPRQTWPDFDGVQLLTSGVESAGSQPIINPDDANGSPTQSDLSRPVRISTIADMTDTPDPSFWTMSLHRATLAELRGGKPPFLSSQPHLRFAIASLYPYGFGSSVWTRGFLGWHDREQQWLRWGQNIRVQPDKVLHDRVQMLISLQFSRRYDWIAYVRAHRLAPRLAISCDAASARRFFAARDLPKGAGRRAALRHWVTEHYRGTQPKVGVVSHFRGASEFDWRELQCELVPSEYDRDRVGTAPGRPLRT